MAKYNKITAIIPARGGSKSIPRKNVKLLGNKPLIAYPILLAKSIKKIQRVIVTTDDEEIAKVAKKFGAEVPFIRPKEISDDETPTLPVLQHCVKYLEDEESYKPDLIVLLYPTCPFLKSSTVERAIDIIDEKGCNSIVSVTEDYGRYWVHKNNKYEILYPEERVNRQYYKPLYKENGAIYFSNYDTLITRNLIVDDDNVEFIVMDEDELVDIDMPSDWKRAEQIMVNKNGDN